MASSHRRRYACRPPRPTQPSLSSCSIRATGSLRRGARQQTRIPRTLCQSERPRTWDGRTLTHTLAREHSAALCCHAHQRKAAPTRRRSLTVRVLTSTRRRGSPYCTSAPAARLPARDRPCLIRRSRALQTPTRNSSGKFIDGQWFSRSNDALPGGENVYIKRRATCLRVCFRAV